MTKMMNSKMNKTMTAACAGAAFCCACAASHTAILSVLGAIIMASIIICGLIISLRAIAMIAIIIAILVLVVGLVIQKANVPWCCELAI